MMFDPKNPEHLVRYRRTIDAILDSKELKWVRLALDNSSMEVVLSGAFHNDKVLIDGIRNLLCSEDVMNYVLWRLTWGLDGGITGRLDCDQVLDGMMVKLQCGGIPVRSFSVFLDPPEWANGCVGYLRGDDYYKYEDDVEGAFYVGMA